VDGYSFLRDPKVTEVNTGISVFVVSTKPCTSCRRKIWILSRPSIQEEDPTASNWNRASLRQQALEYSWWRFGFRSGSCLGQSSCRPRCLVGCYFTTNQKFQIGTLFDTIRMNSVFFLRMILCRKIMLLFGPWLIHFLLFDPILTLPIWTLCYLDPPNLCYLTPLLFGPFSYWPPFMVPLITTP
jgi:hypothetical protein